MTHEEAELRHRAILRAADSQDLEELRKLRAVADAARAVDAWICHEVRCVDPCEHPPCVLTRRIKELDAKEEPR